MHRSKDVGNELIEARELSNQWLAVATEMLDGTPIDNATPRQRAAVALHQLSFDHHAAIRLLIDAEMMPPARALYRPQVDAYVRGLWLHVGASDTEADRFLRTGTIPKIDPMLSAISRSDAALWGPLAEVKQSIWNQLCDQTHGGKAQVLSRQTADEIGRQFSASEALRYLMASTNLSALAAIGIAAVPDRVDLADALLRRFREIFPRAHALGTR